jgi:integrase
MPRKTLTDRGVAALRPRAKRFAFADPELVGHYVRVQPSGARSYVAVAVDPRDRKQVWATIGACSTMEIDPARERARAAIARIKEGLAPFETPPPKADTVEHVCEQWLKRHVRKNGLRSEHEVTRLLHAHVYPAWKGRAMVGIRRSDVAALLDEIEDDHGGRQADIVLSIFRSAANWYAARHDDYVPPIVRGMRRTRPKERARTRVLDDSEIKGLWAATEDGSPYSAFVRLLLLLAQRREKILTMQWQDLSLDYGVWVIPSAPREKGNAGTLQLPKVAIDLIRAQPRLGNNPFVFPGRRGGHMNDLAKCKRALDARMPAGTPQWQLHDLRRTARSLLSRAGVLSEHAEKVMGHAIAGVEGVYDRHAYRDEKDAALARLAALIDAIVHERSADVIPMTPMGKLR